jgi:hypothetical protein
LWFCVFVGWFFFLTPEFKSSKPVLPSFTPDLESCPNSHQVWFLFSVNLYFYFF